MRETKVGVACGRKRIGKTFTTLQQIDDYVRGNPAEGIIGRKALVFDVNNEFSQIPHIGINQIKLFSVHPTIEARRILPFFANGEKMTLNDLADTLQIILRDFSGGLLLIEDINKYISDSQPNDLIGAICTNAHSDVDIIMHYQALGRLTPKMWQNINWVRFHKNSSSIDSIKNKLDEKYEIFKLTEYMINHQYQIGNTRYYLYIDLDIEKIKGLYTREMFVDAIENYLAVTTNYNRIVAPLINKKVKFEGKKFGKEEAIKEIITDKLKQYTGFDK